MSEDDDEDRYDLMKSRMFDRAVSISTAEPAEQRREENQHQEGTYTDETTRKKITT